MAIGWEFDLWVMKATGSNQTQLTKEPGWEVRPDWSPNGKTIAYEHGNVGVDTQVLVLTMATGKSKALTSGTSSYMPTWSPKGTHIAFTRGKDVALAPAHIWIFELKTGKESQVTFGNLRDYFPDWR